MEGWAEVLAPAVVGRGEDPTVAVPGVGDLLVPAICEHPATIVVIPEHADPGLVVKTWAIVP